MKRVLRRALRRLARPVLDEFDLALGAGLRNEAAAQ